jgi:hypothetical protein
MGKSLKKVLALRKKKTPNKPPSAMDTVINTSELLEAILEQLPFLDLVIATGVNHRFRDTVRSSRILKRKLFLLPIAPKEDKRNKYGVLGGSTSKTCWKTRSKSPPSSSSPHSSKTVQSRRQPTSPPEQSASTICRTASSSPTRPAHT